MDIQGRERFDRWCVVRSGRCVCFGLREEQAELLASKIGGEPWLTVTWIAHAIEWLRERVAA